MMEIEKLMTGSMQLSGRNKELEALCKKRWDDIAKPLDSMGLFEKYIAQINAILGREVSALDKTGIVVFCADNGIVEEGISQSDQSITAICAKNIAAGASAVGQMAKVNGTDIFAVDVGMNTTEKIDGVIDMKVAAGTKNFSKEPAMTKEHLLLAMQHGMDIVKNMKTQGYELLGMGEMGIGNTTTSAAVCAALLKVDAEVSAGPGAGANKEQMNRKKQVITNAIKQYDLWNKEVLEVLSCVGGFDIAAMVGMCIGGAYYKVPIVLDGLISMTAALAAKRLLPVTGEYMIPSHAGKEPAVVLLCKELDAEPVLSAKMALGEGTGAVLMISLLKTANAIYKESVTFEHYGMENYERFGEQ